MPFLRRRAAQRLGSSLTAAFVAVWVLVGAAPQAQKAPARVTAGDKIFGLTKIHKLRITVSAAEWAVGR